MMTDEQPIEEAAKAMFYANIPSTMNRDQWDALWPEGDTQTAYRALARAAWAVFEEAQAETKSGLGLVSTPDDDEREAHRRVIDLWFANWRDIGRVSPALEVAIDSLEGMVSDALDAGFRRSEVPEPRTEEALSAEYDARLGDGDRDDPEPLIEPSTCQGCTEDDRVGTACRACGRPYAAQSEPATAPASELEVRGGAPTGVAEPQGEPSDGQVLAALNAYYADYLIADWEYATARFENDDDPIPAFEGRQDVALAEAGYLHNEYPTAHVVRRQKAGPWVPVEQGGVG